MSEDTEIQLELKQNCSAECLESLCEKYNIHTYEAINGKGWIAATKELRGKGDTRREAEVNLLNKIGTL